MSVAAMNFFLRKKEKTQYNNPWLMLLQGKKTSRYRNLHLKTDVPPLISLYFHETLSRPLTKSLPLPWSTDVFLLESSVTFAVINWLAQSETTGRKVSCLALDLIEWKLAWYAPSCFAKSFQRVSATKYFSLSPLRAIPYATQRIAKCLLFFVHMRRWNIEHRSWRRVSEVLIKYGTKDQNNNSTTRIFR